MANLSDVYEPELGGNEAPPPIPAGEYKAVLASDEKKPTANGTGSYLKLEFEVIDGPYKGRKVFNNLNLWNANAQAVEIAKKELNSIIAASGVVPKTGQGLDSAMLYGIPMMIKVTQKKDEYQGEERINNVIKGYRSLKDGQASPQQQAPTTSTGAGGWMKKKE